MNNQPPAIPIPRDARRQFIEDAVDELHMTISDITSPALALETRLTIIGMYLYGDNTMKVFYFSTAKKDMWKDTVCGEGNRESFKRGIINAVNSKMQRLNYDLNK